MRKSSFVACLLLFFCFTSGSAQKKINFNTAKDILQNKDLASAHIGIYIYEPATGKTWYNHNADKYFVPASNTKLFTLYTALKTLGDSVAGMQYYETENAIYLKPTGDPTFLHSHFPVQPVVKWLQQTTKKVYINDSNWQSKPLGTGWSWDDYSTYYMTERNALPVYGNVIKWTQIRQEGSDNPEDNIVYSEPEVDWKVRFDPLRTSVFNVIRERDENVFKISAGTEILKTIEVPFITNGIASALELLKDTLHQEISLSDQNYPQTLKTVYSQPLDSILSYMMHNSDNFMAEQILLMCAGKKLGVMSDKKMIDTLLHDELKNIPQAPSWADGSGLSRYNLFTPKDFVWVLERMKNEFAWQRLTAIFPTGGEGSLKNYYKPLVNNLYAKTGTLTGQSALSGYLTTRKNKQLIFSIIINNHRIENAEVRRAVERFLLDVWEGN